MPCVLNSQALAEKEKEAESFYKSSDSEDDTQHSMSSVSKNEEQSSVTNERIASTHVSMFPCTTTSITDMEKHTAGSNFDDEEEEKKKLKEIDKCILDTVEILDEQILRDQCNSAVSNENRDNNLTTETMQVSETPDDINNEETAEVLQKIFENCMADATVTSINLYNNITTQNENEANDECAETDCTTSVDLVEQTNDTLSKIQDNSIIKDCDKSNSHVFGLPLPSDIYDDTNKRRLASNSKITRQIPKLKGSPGMIIDLTGDTKSNTKGANTLLDRFFSKHVNAKKQTDNKSEVSVLYLQDTPNGPVPTKEVLPYKFPTSTEHNPELDKPGAKLRRLKESLKLQMLQKRVKELEERKENVQTQEEEEWSEEEDLDAQEEDNDLRLTDSGESEPEENDVCIKDKKRTRCLFADDEAQETDDEGSDANMEDVDENYMECGKRSNSSKRKTEYVDDDETEICDDDEDHEDEENSDVDIEDGSVSDRDNDSPNDREDDNIIMNRRNRIKEFSDDSNSTDLINLNNLENDNQLRSQVCKTPLTKTSMLDFVSPVTQLSVLNTTLDSNKKDSPEKTEYLGDELKFASMENTQSEKHARDVENKNIFKKKLFDDAGETVDEEYLMQLCSGKFESTQRTDLDSKGSSQFSIFETQQLHYETSHMRQDDMKQSKSLEVRDENSQDIKLRFNEDSNNSVDSATAVKKNSATSSLKRKLRIASSDDEDEMDKNSKPKFRSARKWNVSDSEEEENVQFSGEEDENDDEESINNNAESENDDDEEQYIDYDSEENEVVVVPKKNLKNVAADFLENEAELSESDWDSADEDEKDMDKLEMEEGDEEEIDEDEVKNQLGKIHAKQMLDEDKREVRIMKELLFEDGDLYTDGTGRERKFKWRNIGENI